MEQRTAGIGIESARPFGRMYNRTVVGIPTGENGRICYEMHCRFGDREEKCIQLVAGRKRERRRVGLCELYECMQEDLRPGMASPRLKDESARRRLLQTLGVWNTGTFERMIVRGRYVSLRFVER